MAENKSITEEVTDSGKKIGKQALNVIKKSIGIIIKPILIIVLALILLVGTLYTIFKDVTADGDFEEWLANDDKVTFDE